MGICAEKCAKDFAISREEMVFVMYDMEVCVKFVCCFRTIMWSNLTSVQSMRLSMDILQKRLFRYMCRRIEQSST